MVRASAEEDVKPQEAEEEMQDELEEAEDSLEQEDIPEVKESGTLSEEEAATREIRLDELRAAQEKAKEEMAAKPKEKSSTPPDCKGSNALRGAGEWRACCKRTGYRGKGQHKAG